MHDQIDFYTTQLQSVRQEVSSLSRRSVTSDPESLAQKAQEKDTLETLLITNAEKA